jgi:hypothetical protein
MMVRHVLTFAILCGAISAHAQGYDPQCMSLCTNAKYDYTFCQMQCSRGSGSGQVEFRPGLVEGLESASRSNLQDAQTRLLNEQTKALQQQNAQQSQPASSPQLKAALEQITKEIKEACGREEYKPLFAHTACNANDITLEQLTDKTTIAGTDKPAYSRLRSDSRAFATKVANALRAYGGAKGADIAMARERAETLYDRNGLALYEETISWGDYNKRRKEIADSLRDEVNQIVRAK